MQIVNRFEKDFSNVIQWNTEPLLANPLTFWRDWWNAKTWIKWHSLVKSKYGVDRANAVLVEWWNKLPIASPQVDYRSFDADFKKYAKENGFFDALFGGALGTVAKVSNAAKDTTVKAIDTGVKVIEGAGNVIESGGNIIGFLSENFTLIFIIALIAIITVYFVM